MIARALAWLLLKTAGKEEREMLVRLYAGEIIMGRITEDDVPAKLKARVHKYLVDMGYFDDVEEYAHTTRRAASCGPPAFMR